MLNHRPGMTALVLGLVLSAYASTIGLAQEPPKADPKPAEAKKPDSDPKKPSMPDLKREYDLVYTKAGTTELKLEMLKERKFTSSPFHVTMP